MVVRPRLRLLAGRGSAGVEVEVGDAEDVVDGAGEEEPGPVRCRGRCIGVSGRRRWS